MRKVVEMGRWIEEEDGSKTWNPYSLKFYEEEHKKFSESYNKKICGEEIEIVFRKLRRHYKLYCFLVINGRTSGHFRGNRIEVPYNTYFGLLCHEIAHAIDNKKRRSKHDKKLMRIIGRVINYCKKKNYWEEEIRKRTEIKVKPEPTKEELQLKKIEKRKNDLVRYEKKFIYYTKLYSNKIKKAKRSLLMLQRHLSQNFLFF